MNWRIGNDHRDVLVGNQRRRPRCNLSYLANRSTDLDAVADADWSFQQQDQSTEEIVLVSVLQSEAESDANRADQHIQRGEIDPAA
jgi:hypothetical protein